MFARVAAATLLATATYAQGACILAHGVRGRPVATRSRTAAQSSPLHSFPPHLHAAMPDHSVCVSTDLNADASTARNMLFSNPGAELPDVYLSESVVFVEESDAGTTNSQTYTVVLTHPPGMREDETVRSLRVSQ